MSSPSTEGAQTDQRGNAAAASDVERASGDASIFSKMPGGEDLHAGACGCASCLGGSDLGRSSEFTEILEDGTVVKNGAAPASGATGSPGGSGSGVPLPGAAGPSQSLQAVHPEFPAVYGQTYYSESDLPSFPSVSFEVSRTLTLDHHCKVRKTSWGEPNFPVLSTSANGEGYKVARVHPLYPDFDHYVIVGEKAAENVARAEEQHVQDLNMGWNITANVLGDAINAEAAGDGYANGDAETAKQMCVDAIVNRLGALGAALAPKIKSGGAVNLAGYMNNAFTQSKAKRDQSGNHSFGTELVTADHAKKRVASKVDETKVLEGSPASAVVNLGTIL
jgi:hypothetical protein